MGHADPPAHFHKGLRTVDQIELKEMILPLVCIDVRARSEHFCSIGGSVGPLGITVTRTKANV